MVKLDRPKKGTLPNGKPIYAKYKIFSGNALANNITKVRTHQRKSRRGQRGSGVGKTIKKCFSLAKKIAKSKN